MRRVSIVLPNFNSVKYLSRVIESFLSQDYKHKRLIIVDGKSTDGSHEIIRNYSKNNLEVEWIRKDDFGISNSINIALDYIDAEDIWGYLGADDLLMPGVLTRVANFFSLEKSTTGVYFDSYSLAPNESSVRMRRCPQVEFSESSLIRYGTIVGLQNIYIDAGLVKKFRFNEKSKYAMDYDIYLRLLKSGHKMFFYVPESSTINIQEGNISQVFSRKANAEALKIARELTGVSAKLLVRYVRHYLSGLLRCVVR